MIDLRSKIYFVGVNEDGSVYYAPAHNISFSMSIGGETEFRGSLGFIKKMWQSPLNILIDPEDVINLLIKENEIHG